MTDDEFLNATAQRMGRTPQQVLRRDVILPCACGSGGCCGWINLPRSDLQARDNHMRTHHPRPMPSVSASDFVAREQRRLKGHRYTWPPLTKGEDR